MKIEGVGRMMWDGVFLLRYFVGGWFVVSIVVLANSSFTWGMLNRRWSRSLNGFQLLLARTFFTRSIHDQFFSKLLDYMTKPWSKIPVHHHC